MSLSANKPLTVSATGDGSAALRLVGTAGKYAVTRDGVSIGTVTSSGGALLLSRDFGGTHTYVLTPLG
jgi:hypothetical protein